MKKYLLPLLFSFVVACNSNEETQTTETIQDGTATKTETPAISNSLDSMCFVRTEGKGNVDTFAVKLYTEGDKVWGKLMYLYYEKDWRMGRFKGTRNGDVVNAKWVFLQEGMQDSADIAFKIQDNNILQKEVSYDAKTGREVLNEAAPYNREYRRVDCDKFPRYDFDFGL